MWHQHDVAVRRDGVNTRSTGGAKRADEVDGGDRVRSPEVEHVDRGAGASREYRAQRTFRLAQPPRRRALPDPADPDVSHDIAELRGETGAVSRARGAPV